MRATWLEILARVSNRLKGASISLGHNSPTDVPAGLAKPTRLQVLRDLVNYVRFKIIASVASPYDARPRIARKERNDPKSAIAPVVTQQNVDFYHSPQVVRRTQTHKVCVWDQNKPHQYNSINQPVPLRRPSTAGKALYKTETTHVVRHHDHPDHHTPNLELHTWNAKEPTQYGYWYNQPIKRRQASQIRMISKKQMNKMHFTKECN